ncbi:MAG TPA: CaiB/BaiF CoA-transferase family protein [Dehalococcoidia bacterium]|nr:CaiB/BaiF CoA-transferase family protein [Dehalococcoidia bacterium]
MLPLSDLRVVAVEQAVAVPLATRHLADLGADVIKIERPDGGDFARGYDGAVNGLSVTFAWLNRNKRSVCLDLKAPADLAVAAELAARADIFVQNLAPGAAARLGLGAAALRTRNPRLIYCSLSGYGDSGPYEQRKAYDALIQGETGASTVSGTPEQPARIGLSVVDISGAMHVFGAVLAALHRRERTGEGHELSIALFDTIADWMGVPLLTTKYGGEHVRTGLFHSYIAPYGPFRCGDQGTVNIAVQSQREWIWLCERVLEQPELATDARFATNPGRFVNREPLREIIEAVFARLGLAETVARLERAGVAFGEQREAKALSAHPNLAARERWQSVPSEVGAVELLRSPFDAASGWRTPAGAIPSLGQHTDEVLAEFGLRRGG